MQSQMLTSKLGAELISYKLDGIEKIHQGQDCIDENGRVYWKRHFPVLFPIVGKLKQNKTIIDYVEAIKNKENCENLEIKHDLSNTVLKGNLKRMMKRIAKAENKIDGMEVIGLQESKIAGLLGKKRIKNKPVTIEEGLKFTGKIKAVEKVRNLSKKAFTKAIKVTGAVKEEIKKVSEVYKENDLEKLEDKEDPDLEETEPKIQEDEEQEK